MKLEHNDPAVTSIDSVACGFSNHRTEFKTSEAAEFCRQWIASSESIEVDEGRVRQLIDFGVAPIEARRQAVVEAAAEAWWLVNGGPELFISPVPRRVRKPR